MLKERMSRKGQEGVSLTTLLLIILGVVVIVVIILGFTGAFSFIFNKVSILPGQDLQAVATSCEIAGQNNLIADYCNTYKEAEIDGVKQYVNCEDPRVQAGMKAEVKSQISVVCGTDAEKGNSLDSFCASGKIKGADFGKTLINGKTCATIMNLVEGTDCTANTSAGNGYVLAIKPSCGSGEADITGFTKTPVMGTVISRCCVVAKSAAK